MFSTSENYWSGQRLDTPEAVDLLATISLTPKQLEKSVLLSGSDLSYNERTIGLTVHCKSFHARTANCEPTLPLQRSIYAG